MEASLLTVFLFEVVYLCCKLNVFRMALQRYMPEQLLSEGALYVRARLYGVKTKFFQREPGVVFHI
jgi:hypothetical protein